MDRKPFEFRFFLWVRGGEPIVMDSVVTPDMAEACESSMETSASRLPLDSRTSGCCCGCSEEDPLPTVLRSVPDLGLGGKSPFMVIVDCRLWRCRGFSIDSEALQSKNKRKGRRSRDLQKNDSRLKFETGSFGEIPFGLLLFITSTPLL